ncbi:hypothetical protein [Erythrobacter aureus]|uniref:RES domain-containing protein n=1 Tax=Erythrobacter aureus TaxID=2182384 RepID=A0A345YIX3_9SPHN|nr:hypothetical protein [Erythrobacter aureus]AXK43875.1 hypothetical protein DVR09_15585 [Erythrobacter aureus]
MHGLTLGHRFHPGRLWSDLGWPVVYHSTDWGDEIVKDGFIKGNPLKMAAHIEGRSHEGRTGISVTRSAYFARQFANIIFVLDLRRLRQRYRLSPRAEGAYDAAHPHGDYRLEAEEFIHAERIDLAPYLLGIWLKKQDWGGIEFEGRLLNHPKFRGFFREPSC